MEPAIPTVSVSVVLYRDYVTPLVMIQSLFRYVSSSLNVLVYVVDNSEAEKCGMSAARDDFLSRVRAIGPIEYIDAGGNLGFGKANNLALSRSEADYHAFVNPDIRFIEDSLSILKEFLDDRQEVGMTIPRMLDDDGVMQPVYRREVTVLDAANRTLLRNRMRNRDRWHTLADKDYSIPFEVPFGQGSFLFGRTSLLKSLGGFDDRFFMYLEDADLCKRINEVSCLLYCPDTAVVHRWERASHKNARLMKEHIRSYVRYFRKWGLKLF